MTELIVLSLTLGCLRRHVSGRLNLVRKRLDGDSEAVLNLLKDGLVLIRGNECDGETLGAESAGTADAVEVCVCVGGHVVVEDNVNTLEVNTSAEDVGRDKNTRAVVLEGGVSFNTSLLIKSRVHVDRGEVALIQDLVKEGAALYTLDKDNNLVELEVVQKAIELSGLLVLLELDVVLKETMKSQLALVNKDFERRVHESASNVLGVTREGGREHHYLLLTRSCLENLLNNLTHLDVVQERVALIKDKALELANVKILLVDQLLNTTGSTNDDVRAVCLEDILVLLNRDTAEEDLGLDLREVLGEAKELLANLEGKLTSVAQDDCVHTLGTHIRDELLEGSQDEDGSLTRTRLGLAENVLTVDSLRKAFLLNFGGVLESSVLKRLKQARVEQEVTETRCIDTSIRTPVLWKGKC